MTTEVSVFDECLTDEKRGIHVRVVMQALGYPINAEIEQKIKEVSKNPEKYREFCKAIEESNGIFDEQQK